MILLEDATMEEIGNELAKRKPLGLILVALQDDELETSVYSQKLIGNPIVVTGLIHHAMTLIRKRLRDLD